MIALAPPLFETTNVIDTIEIETPLGIMIAGGVEDGICLLEFSDRRMLNTEYKQLKQYFSAKFVKGENPHFELLRKEIKEYFSHKLKDFTVPLNAPGTVFQKAVWKELRNIPFGKTRSYKEQSEAIGNPGAIRAVATANGANRISIIIPCHRVIGADGSLTGYGGGLWRKKWLLEHEGNVLKLFA